MNKILVIFTALLLSACAGKPSELTLPAQIKYQNKLYQQTAGQDLGTIARYVYLSKPDTLENWQSQIELLLDRNQPPRSIKDRIALRERVYRNTEVKSFQLTPTKAGLTGYVIYAPTEKNPSWQVDVMKGLEMPQCGFVQFQYSQKVKNSRHLSEEKVLQHVQKYLVEKQMKALNNMDWQWHCQNQK